MTQEDSELIFHGSRFIIAAVFDGHGGSETSRFCAANFAEYF
jgi:serine/threonine protein phosphatase PrpC